MRFAKHSASFALAAIVLGGTSALTPAAAQEALLGELRLFAGTYCPRHWQAADGQILPINQYQSLYALYGTKYGGDGRTTFALPDLQGRAPIGYGQGTSLANYPMASKGGSETIQMNSNNLPSHNHPATTTAELKGTTDTGDTDTPGSTVVLADGRGDDIYGTGPDLVPLRNNAISATTTVNQTGGQFKTQRAPYLAMNWCVALQGTFPSRN